MNLLTVIWMLMWDLSMLFKTIKTVIRYANSLRLICLQQGFKALLCAVGFCNTDSEKMAQESNSLLRIDDSFKENHRRKRHSCTMVHRERYSCNRNLWFPSQGRQPWYINQKTAVIILHRCFVLFESKLNCCACKMQGALHNDDDFIIGSCDNN